MSEPDLFIESSGLLLGLDIDKLYAKLITGCFNSLQHNPFSEAFAALCSDYPPDRYLVHMGTSRADSAYRHYFIALREPYVDRGFVVSVKVLIDAVLLYDKHL